MQKKYVLNTKKHNKQIGYSKIKKGEYRFEQIVQTRDKKRGSSHGIMRCIYAKAQIGLKRPHVWEYYKSFTSLKQIREYIWKKNYLDANRLQTDNGFLS